MLRKMSFALSEQAIRNRDLVEQAIASARDGDKEAARSLLQRAVECDPENEEIWLWKASLAENLPEAIAHVRRILHLNPHNLKALWWLRRALQASRRVGPSWKCPLCRQSSATNMVRCLHCRAVVDLSDLDAFTKNEGVKETALIQSIERFRSILRRGPDWHARLGLAIAYLNLNDTCQAITHLKEACRLCPEDSELREKLETLRQRKLILVMDYSWAERNKLAAILERNGLRFRGAANSFQALGLVDSEKPDLILLDVSMPRRGGYEVCRVLRRNTATKDIPLILISDDVGILQRAWSRWVGASDFIAKPVEPPLLLKKLEAHLAHSHPLQSELAMNTVSNGELSSEQPVTAGEDSGSTESPVISNPRPTD